jgi:hypothetical protein
MVCGPSGGPTGWESKQDEVSRPWMMAAPWFAPTSYVTLWHGHYPGWMVCRLHIFTGHDHVFGRLTITITTTSTLRWSFLSRLTLGTKEPHASLEKPEVLLFMGWLALAQAQATRRISETYFTSVGITCHKSVTTHSGSHTGSDPFFGFHWH